MMHVCWCLIITIVFYFNCNDAAENPPMVLVSTESNMKYIEVPTSNSPLLIGMEVYKGLFPNITKDPFPVREVNIGEPVSLVIFLIDNAYMYDPKVNNCWAHDDAVYENARHKLRFNEIRSNSKTPVLSEWNKYEVPKQNKTIIHAHFKSFKFPEKDKVFVTCDMKMVGKNRKTYQ